MFVWRGWDQVRGTSYPVYQGSEGASAPPCPSIPQHHKETLLLAWQVPHTLRKARNPDTNRPVHNQPCSVPLSPIPYRPPCLGCWSGFPVCSCPIYRIPGETYPASSQFTSHDPRMPPLHAPGVHHAVSTLSACVLGSASFLLIYFSPHSLLGSEISCFKLSGFITTAPSPPVLSPVPVCSPESSKATSPSSPPPWTPLPRIAACVGFVSSRSFVVLRSS